MRGRRSRGTFRHHRDQNPDRGLESDELNAAASADFLRGVAPGSRKLYERALRGDGTFECLDGSGSVGSESLNDDFCDCEDGSDEPGTSACASGILLPERE